MVQDFSFKCGDWLVFGSETSGLLPEVLNDCTNGPYGGGPLRIPMVETYVRCLNLSVSVGIALYEASRQLGYEQMQLHSGSSPSNGSVPHSESLPHIPRDAGKASCIFKLINEEEQKDKGLQKIEEDIFDQPSISQGYLIYTVNLQGRTMISATPSNHIASV
ncbi:tRNA (cytidine(34)-2'-O)-methyltransferase [Nymphaea thermarum]|nr:tRNA (cytidine(34)-2'-O)-methyltransferase [Nymphaea thermarum]